MTRRAFRTPANAPLLWERPVCTCYQFYQYYLCGCPDDGSSNHERERREPSTYRCDMWYAPDWIKRMAEKYGFQHNPNPPVDNKPHVLPFPCHRHLTESRVFLSPEALRATRKRLLDPKWNPVSAARMNRNRRVLQQQFVGEHRGWETRKRVREMDDDNELSQQRPRKRAKPEGEALAALRQRLDELMVASLLAEEQRRRSNLSAQSSPNIFPTQQEVPESPSRLANNASSILPPEPTRKTRYFLRPPKKTVRLNLTDTSSPSSTSSSPPSSPPSANPSPPTSSPPSTSSPPPPTPPPTPSTPSKSDSGREPTSSSSSSSSSPPLPPPSSSSSSSSSSLWSYFTLPPPRTTAEQRFASLTWLAEEQAVDLWALDGYRWRCPPLPLPAPPPAQQQQQQCRLSVEQQQEEKKKKKKKKKKEYQPRDVPHDGNTHRGYHQGAYMTDGEVLRQARVANWSTADPTGWWAGEVGRWAGEGGWALGEREGGWFGFHLSME